MDHGSMSMSMSMSSTATATSSAIASSSSTMSMDMDMGMGGSCKISMLWNWYTIDACFISKSWRIRSNGAFAASCIGVILLVVTLEALRRLGKEYDAHILRKFQQNVVAQATEVQPLNGSNTDLSGPQFATFRPSPLQQLIRSIIHAATFGVAYIVMLLAMYYNGYFIICIFLGAGLGKFVCDWVSIKIPTNFGVEKPKVDAPEEPTMCCG